MKSIESDRLLLRKWLDNDYQDLFEYASDPQVGNDAGFSTIMTMDDAKRIISNYIIVGHSMAIVLKEKNKVIGSIGMDQFAPVAELQHLKQRYIGFSINPKYWGNGYATEAVKCFAKSLFSEFELDVIWSSHYYFNERSKRVLEKCGFEYRFTRESIVKAFGNKRVSELFYILGCPIVED